MQLTMTVSMNNSMYNSSNTNTSMYNSSNNRIYNRSTDSIYNSMLLVIITYCS